MKCMWRKLSKQGFLTEKYAANPGEGVWIQSDRQTDFQHTIERIALNGNVLHSLHARCGQHRSAAIKLAVAYAKSTPKSTK